MSDATSVVDALKPFELEVIRVLAAHALTPNALAALAKPAAPILYRYSGCGYFLTLKDPSFPIKRQTLCVPPIVGRSENIVSGFVVFVGNGELTLECHDWGHINVPSDFRDRDVVVREPLPEDFSK